MIRALRRLFSRPHRAAQRSRLHVVSNAGFHHWRYAQRLVNAGEVVPDVAQRDCGHVVLNLLRERIGEPREPALPSVAADDQASDPLGHKLVRVDEPAAVSEFPEPQAVDAIPANRGSRSERLQKKRPSTDHDGQSKANLLDQFWSGRVDSNPPSLSYGGTSQPTPRSRTAAGHRSLRISSVLLRSRASPEPRKSHINPATETQRNANGRMTLVGNRPVAIQL